LATCAQGDNGDKAFHGEQAMSGKMRSSNPFTLTRTEAAVAARDKVVGRMDATWGTDVVQTLVSPETAAKFASVLQKRDLAQQAGDDDEFIRWLGQEVRGLEACDAEARERGHTPLKVERSWTARDEEGRPWVFVQDEDTARAAVRSGRFAGYQVWSLPEVMRVLRSRELEAVLKAKELFAEASVADVKAVDWTRGDEVPF
jgi:hypothetical protein